MWPSSWEYVSKKYWKCDGLNHIPHQLANGVDGVADWLGTSIPILTLLPFLNALFLSYLPSSSPPPLFFPPPPLPVPFLEAGWYLCHSAGGGLWIIGLNSGKIKVLKVSISQANWTTRAFYDIIQTPHNIPPWGYYALYSHKGLPDVMMTYTTCPKEQWVRTCTAGSCYKWETCRKCG